MTVHPSGDLLGTIVAAARRIVEVRAASRPLPVLERSVTRTPDGRAFAARLARPGELNVIAECKRRSPSKGLLREAYDPARHAAAYARAGAAAISVLTEPTFFDGALEHLAAVRAAVDVPLLRKDFVVSPYQLVEAAAAGADAALLIVGALDDDELRSLQAAAAALGLATLVEVHDGAELRRAADSGARIIGVNSRNLRTLTVHPEVFDALAPLMPPGIIAVAESGIRSRDDMARLRAIGYQAFLVGERLITQPDPGQALAELVCA